MNSAGTRIRWPLSCGGLAERPIAPDCKSGDGADTTELDEQWAFIGKKQKHITESDSSELGDCYLFTAIAATQKAILSYAVGKRNGVTTEEFVNDLRAQILNRL